MKIYSIAINTFKEVIRDRIFYSLVFFAALILGASVLISSLTIGEQAKIIEDLSLGSINFFGVIISIFVGIGLVSKEIEKKTIYTIISKPIRRYEFLLGKYLGLALTLFIYIFLMTACFFTVLYAYMGVPAWNLLLAVVFIYLELLVVTAAALLFSTFSTPTLSATYTLAIYIIGHLLGDLKGLAQKAPSELAKGMLVFLYYALPNLNNFNIKGQAVHNMQIPAEQVLMTFLYGILYIFILLVIAGTVFQKRNFK